MAHNIPMTFSGAGASLYCDSSAATNIRFYYSAAAFDSTNNSIFSNEASGVSADNWKFIDASQGGTVRLPDGAYVELPKDAVSQNDNMLIREIDRSEYSSYKIPSNIRATDIVYEIKFENPGTRLLKPASIALPYADSDIAGMKEENLRLYTWNGKWIMVNTSKVYPSVKRVGAAVSHFSIFRIMEYLPSGLLLDSGAVYTYPNPARGDRLTFKFLVADRADVVIDVYNVAGEKIARLEKKNCPAGIVSELEWEIAHIASGVYQYRLSAESASDKKSIIKRLAIIH